MDRAAVSMSTAYKMFLHARALYSDSHFGSAFFGANIAETDGYNNQGGEE